MKSHKEFMEEVAEKSSLPAQTKKALGPESEEDFELERNQMEAKSKTKWDYVESRKKQRRL